jgi:prepilin-type N-terminal cleavage/methylation domain-containing protein
VRRLKRHDSWYGEQGFTLVEVMVVIVLMGIVLGIASSSWFGIVESNRVTSAANQLGSDMRLAHTKSTNQLATWRVVLVTGRAGGPDYYLVKLDSGGNIVAGSTISRHLPDTTRIVTPATVDSTAIRAIYTVLGLGSDPSRTMEFKADGSMTSLAGTGPVEVTQDGNPLGTITYTQTTSRISVVS